jgi:hypothetical protein
MQVSNVAFQKACTLEIVLDGSLCRIVGEEDKWRKVLQVSPLAGLSPPAPSNKISLKY